MSIDIDIAPLRSTPIVWQNVVERWGHYLGSSAGQLLGDHPSLIHIGNRLVVPAEQCLTPPMHCSLQLAHPNTLALSVASNLSNLDEVDYVEDYGQNLEAKERGLIARLWHDVAYHLSLSSGGGRTVEEPVMLRSLATAIAELCDGRIFLMHSGVFDLKVGVYTAQQFARARWQMSA